MELEWNKDEKRVLSIEEFKDECIIFLSKYEEFIFKGASLLERINKNDELLVERSTKDIDITNIGKSKKELKEIVKNFIEVLEDKYDLSGYEIVENTKTLNSEDYYTIDFVIKGTSTINFNLDFSVAGRYNQGFLYHIDIADILGYNVNKIYSDKMSTISTKQIFSRIKDFVDMYNLSFHKDHEISFEEINYFNINNEDFKVGDFRQLLEMKTNIRKAFLKMKGIEINNESRNREEIFEVMYRRVVDFVIPFMPLSNKENFIGTVWDPDSGSWLI